MSVFNKLLFAEIVHGVFDRLEEVIQKVPGPGFRLAIIVGDETDWKNAIWMTTMPPEMVVDIVTDPSPAHASGSIPPMPENPPEAAIDANGDPLPTLGNLGQAVNPSQASAFALEALLALDRAAQRFNDDQDRANQVAGRF